jgi:putative transferase (TIGR04331 family)
MNLTPHTYSIDSRNKHYTTVEALYVKILYQLTEYLNVYHKTTYPLEYWEMIAGPWLRWFTNVVYIRWIEMENFDIKTIEIDGHLMEVPIDLKDVNRLDQDKVYINFLFSLIKAYQNHVSLNLSLYSKTVYKSSTRKLDIYLLISKIFASKVLFYRTNFFILRRIRYGIWKFINFNIYKGSYENLTEKKIVNRPSTYTPRNNNTVFDFLSIVIPDFIPAFYLEDYDRLCSDVNYFIGDFKKIKCILTANGQRDDDFFRLIIAEMKRKFPVKLYILQHGGTYGLMKNFHSESEELRLADGFLTWGWTKYHEGKFINIGVGKWSKTFFLIIRYLRFFKWKNGPINVFPAATFSFNYRIDDFSLCYNQPATLREIICLKNHFVKNISENYKINLHPYNYEVSNAILNNISKTNLIGYALDTNNYYLTFLKSELIIVAYNGTVYLESIYAGIPTIIYLNSEYSPIYSENTDLLQKLRDNHILHDDYNSLVAFVKGFSSIAEIKKWWALTAKTGIISEFKKTYYDQFNSTKFKNIIN